MNFFTCARLVPLVTLLCAAASSAQVLDPSLWQTDGWVYSVTEHAGTLYVGGAFQHVGPRSGSFAGVDSTTAALLPSLPEFNGQVFAILADGSGGWYLAGSFTKVDGTTRNGLAQLDAGLQLTPWNPDVTGIVRDLDRSGANIYFGGSFTAVGGIARTNLAAVDASTGALTTWTPSTNGPVLTLDAHTHQVSCPSGFCSETWIYFGGQFSIVNGQLRTNLARVEPVSGFISTWAPNPNSAVYALQGTGSTQLRVWVGGAFTSIAGVARNRIAALTTTGSATTWDPNANGDVLSLNIAGATIYAGGSFTSIGGQGRNRLAALSSSTGLASTWDPDVDQNVRSIAVDGSTVYVGGDFENIGGIAHAFAAALDATTGAASAWDPAVNADVRAIAPSGGNVFLGGSFTSANQVERNNLAAFDLLTGEATAWNPDVIGSVGALAVDGTTVYAGGTFTSIGGTARSYIAAIDATTGIPTSWNPSSTGEVQDLVVQGGLVYAAGSFNTIGGAARNALAALDPATGAATAWNPDVTNSMGGAVVNSLAPFSGSMYFGGDFDAVGGQPRANVAAVDLGTGLPTAWAPTVSSWVYCVEVSGAQILIGGTFQQINGVTRPHAAGVDAVSGALTDWNPAPNNWVFEIAAGGTGVYLGGWFDALGGVGNLSHFAEVSAIDGSPSLLDTQGNPWVGANDFVISIATTPTRVYPGGIFVSLGGESRIGLAAVEIETQSLCDPVVDSPSWSACGTPLASVNFGVPWVLRSASDGAGGAYVAWNDQTPDEVRVQRVLADGSIASGWPTGGVTVAPDSTSGIPVLVEDGAGGVFVVWRGWTNGLVQTSVQRYQADVSVAPGWPVGGLQVPGLPANPFSGGEFRAVSDGAGGLFVTTNERIQRVDSSGAVAAGWPLTGVAANDVIDQLVADGFGNAFFVTLALAEFGRVEANATITWQGAYPQPFLYVDPTFLAMEADGAGGFYFACESAGEVRVQRITGLGAVDPSWSLLGTQLAASGRVNDLMRDAAGQVYVAWSELAAPYTAHVQRLTPSGQIAEGWENGGVVIGTPAQNTNVPGLVSDGASGVFVTWLGGDDSASTGLWATRLCGFGTPLPGWSPQGELICPDARFYLLGGGILRRGLLADGAGGAFVPWFRRDGGAGWTGDVSLLRLGSTPPPLDMATVPAGTPSQASLDGVALGFDSVTTGGELYVARIDGPALPGGLQTVPAQGPALYDISTTAVWTGSVQVCVDYDPADLGGQGGTLSLMHYEAGDWVDVTTSVDTDLHQVCGTTTSLSPFAIAEAVSTHAQVPMAPARLDQNHPNPFNPRTTIGYRTAIAGRVTLTVFDVRGRLVRTLVDEPQQAGSHEAIWNGVDARGRSVASGVYFYRLQTPQETLVRRMALVR